MVDRDVESSPPAGPPATPDSRLGLLRELGEQAVLEATNYALYPHMTAGRG